MILDRFVGRTLAWVACGAMALGAVACGSSDSSGAGAGTGGGGGAGGAGGSGGAGVTCNATGDLDIEGTWVALARLAVTFQALPGGVVAICPENQVGSSELLMLYDVKKDPSDAKKATMTAYLCNFTLPTTTAMGGTCDPSADNLVTTELTPGPQLLSALVKLNTPPANVTLDSLNPGAAFNPERSTFITGADPTVSPLPSWDTSTSYCQSDPNAGRTSQCESQCVDCGKTSDDDGDGNPGDTIYVCARTKADVQNHTTCDNVNPENGGVTIQGEAFIDFMTNPQLSGTVKSSCEIAGNVDAQVNYNVIGGNVYLTNTALTIADVITSLPSFQVSKTDSKYEMIRVDGKYGSLDWKLDMTNTQAACQAAIQNQNSIP
jgi:hypothetical protein